MNSLVVVMKVILADGRWEDAKMPNHISWIIQMLRRVY
jgi:hypothetical protein